MLYKKIFNKFFPRKFIIKREKYDFYKYKIDFLDFRIKRNGIRINSAKIKKILN